MRTDHGASRRKNNVPGTSSSSWDWDIAWNQAHSQLLLTYECMADSDGWVNLCALRPPSSDSTDIRGRLVGNRIVADNFESGNDGYWIPGP